MVLLDAGNALFKPGSGADAESKKRAAFILETMGKLGTQVMAAGAKDLVAGSAWLKEQAARAKLPVLSANLVDASGKALFPASTVLEVAGKKIGVIGASPPGDVGGGKGRPVVTAVTAEAKKLRPKTDLIVVLAAIPYPDALQLSREAKDAVDLIVQTHEGRGTGSLQRGEGNFVSAGGERGRQLGWLTVELGGRGQLIDVGQLDRDKASLAYLDQQMEKVKARIDASKDPQGKATLQNTLKQFTERRRQIAAQVTAGQQATGRKLSLNWIVLGTDYREDAALAAAVKRIEPHPPDH